MVFVTEKGMCVRAGKEDVPVQGRVAGGVKGITLSGADKVVFAKEFSRDAVDNLVLATDKGLYKKVAIGTISKIARGGMGVRIVDLMDDLSAKVCFATLIGAEEKSVIYAVGEEGVTSCEDKEVPLESRLGKGKKIKGMVASSKICTKGISFK